MPRSTATSIENNFTRGLITEVTGANSPENSVTESLNVVFDRKGRAVKRGGFQYEDGYELNDYNGIITDSSVFESFLWDSVSGSGSLRFLVVQVGSRLDFYEVASDTALSSSRKSFYVDLLDFKNSVFSNTAVATTTCSFTYGKGYLFVANPYCETFYVRYNSVSDTITTAAIQINIRDFEGVDDDLGLEETPTTLSNSHKYNLYNQGWYDSVVSSFYSNYGYYPPNSLSWWYLLGTDSSGSEVFQPGLYTTLAKGLYGNTPAPKGHFILNPFDTNRTTQVGVSVSENTSEGYRPSVVAFSWGRAFYAGVSGTGYSSSIYFSKIIESDDDLGTCYQSADPTSRENFAIVDSDGGVIKIQNIAQVVDLKPVGDAMFVFATNGVWAITGTDNGAFKATDYSVSKVSSYPAISRSSVVDVGGTPVWWNYEGIFMLQMTDAGFTKQIMNATQSTIKTAYDAIPHSSKLYAKGIYNDQSGVAYWLYNNEQTAGQISYTHILALDAVSTAFYIMKLPDDPDKQIRALSSVRASSEIIETENVVTNIGTIVTDASSNEVTVDTSYGFSTGDKVFKFVTVADNRYLTLSEIVDNTYLDWGDTSYDSYFVTGYRIRGDLLNKFQTNYISIITEDVSDEQSCYVQGIWDYSNNHDSGRYTNPQQVYRQRTFRDYQRCKVKMRGNGYSLQLKFYGESGKAFSIIGWAAFETANQVP